MIEAFNFIIRGDTTPIKQAMATIEGSAKAVGKVAGENFGNQFKAGAMRFLGAGAIIAVIQKAMQNAVRLRNEAMKEGVGVEAMQELERAAAVTGMTIKEIREAAPEAAEAFTRMMEAIQGEGGIIDADAIEDLANVADQLSVFVSKVAPLAAGLFKWLNLTITAGQALMEFVMGKAMATWGRLTGDAELYTSGSQLAAEAIPGGLEAAEKGLVGGTRSREEGRRFSEEVRARRAGIREFNRKEGAAMTGTFSDEKTAAALSGAFGAVGMGAVVKELEKANTKLSELNTKI